MLLLRRTRAGTSAWLAVAALWFAGCAGLPWFQNPDMSYDGSGARDHMRDTLHAQAGEKLGSRDLHATASSKLREGDRYRRHGDLQRALLAYFESARLAPRDTTARSRVAYLEIAVNPMLAERSFQKLLGPEPEYPGHWLGLGLARLARSDLEGARSALERAVQLAPDMAPVLSALGAVYDRQGDFAGAQQHLQHALELQPDETSLLNNLAVSYLLAGQLEEAEALLRRAGELEPGDEVLLNNLGLAVGLQARYTDALEIFRRTGDEQSALNNLGYVYHLAGHQLLALASYERALLERGSHPEEVLRNLDAAQTALERDPDQTR